MPTAKLPHYRGVNNFPHVISPLPGFYFQFVCGFHAGRKGRKYKKFEVIMGIPQNSKVQCESVHSLYHTLIFTADNFTCFTRTYMHNGNDTVVNWFLEKFVTLYVLSRFSEQ